jgi:hypothetical protein
LVQIIKRALHRDENQRYQTVSDMVGDLLPLREVFNEPMSEAVSKALKNSYPPPAPQSGMLAPQKPTTKNLPSLHPSGKAHKADRSDPTASYGTRKRTAGKKITGKKPDSKRAFLGKELPKKNAKEMPPRKPEVGPSQESTNRTLLGMPAITEEQVKQRISNTPLPKAALQPQAPHAQKAKKAVKGSEPLFKPRSILGSEEDIKQLEAEMGFLEEPEDDGDVPTLVATGQSFAAMVGRIAHLKDEELSEKESTKEPSEAVSTTQTIDDDVDIISVSTTVSEPPASQQENAAQPDAPRTQASPTAIGIAPASLPTAIGIAPVSLPTAIGTAPASPPSAVGTAPASPPSAIGTAPASPPSAIGTAPASPPSAIGTAPASPPSAVGTAPVSPSVAGTSPVSPVWGGGTAPASPTVQGFAPASTTSAFEPTPPTADVAPSSDSFTRKKKRNVLLFGAGATVVLVALVAIAVVSIFSEDTPAESAPEATAGTTSPTPSKSASAAVAVTPPAESAVTEVEVQSAELAEPAPADAEKATGAAETPAPEEKTEAFVSIGFNAVPKGATIKINGKTVQAPVKMAKTKKLAAVLITAEGYKTFRVRIVPDRDRQVPVKMKKLPPKSKNNKKKSAGKKSAGKKSKKSNSSLVSNPFTK